MTQLCKEEREALAYDGLTPARVEKAIQSDNVQPICDEYGLEPYEIQWLAYDWGIKE